MRGWKLRLVWWLARRVALPLTVVGLAVVLLPQVLGAVVLRRWLVPAVEARWPQLRPWWIVRGLAVATVAGLAGVAWALDAGYRVPRLPGGVVLFVSVVGGGCVLASSWPLVGGGVRWALRGGGRGNTRANTVDRTASKDGQNGAPVKVTLKPVSTQRIATATYGDTPWTVKPLFGPGKMAMIVAPPGSGKTELCYGALATAADGLPLFGWETSKPRRVLLLSEMEPQTLAPALHRWGFVTTPSGPLDALRLRYLRPQGSPGHLIDVVHASDIYAPGDDGRRPEWADVIQAVLPVLDRGRYDLLMVDSLARWMGNDSSNAAMLDALGALRQVTFRGVGVLAPHHCAKDAKPPYQPRGGSAIMGELDLCWSLAHLPGCTDPLHDPRRVLECTKSRVAELTPPPIRIERVDVDPDAPRPRFGYRLLGTAPAIKSDVIRLDPTDPDTRLSPAPSPPLPPQARTVLAALTVHGDQGATAATLSTATRLPRPRIGEALKVLMGARRVREAGTVPTPGGGKPSMIYVAATESPVTSVAIATAAGADVATVIEAFLHTQAGERRA